MKKFAKVIIVAAMLVLCFTLSACATKYHSNYSASSMVETKTSTKAAVSFGNFSGTYVMRLDNYGADEAIITYKATLEKGNIKV